MRTDIFLPILKWTLVLFIGLSCLGLSSCWRSDALIFAEDSFIDPFGNTGVYAIGKSSKDETLAVRKGNVFLMEDGRSKTAEKKIYGFAPLNFTAKGRELSFFISIEYRYKAAGLEYHYNVLAIDPHQNLYGCKLTESSEVEDVQSKQALLTEINMALNAAQGGIDKVCEIVFKVREIKHDQLPTERATLKAREAKKVADFKLELESADLELSPPKPANSRNTPAPSATSAEQLKFDVKEEDALRHLQDLFGCETLQNDKNEIDCKTTIKTSPTPTQSHKVFEVDVIITPKTAKGKTYYNFRVKEKIKYTVDYKTALRTMLIYFSSAYEQLNEGSPFVELDLKSTDIDYFGFVLQDGVSFYTPGFKLKSVGDVKTGVMAFDVTKLEDEAEKLAGQASCSLFPKSCFNVLPRAWGYTSRIGIRNDLHLDLMLGPLDKELIENVSDCLTAKGEKGDTKSLGSLSCDLLGAISNRRFANMRVCGKIKCDN